MEETNDAIEEAVEEAKEAGVSLGNPRYQAEVLGRFQPKVQKVSAALPAKFGITDAILKVSQVLRE